MAFDDVRLPEEVEQGMTGGPRFQTSVIALGNGSEQRNADWPSQRGEWDISYGISDKTYFMDIIKFFYARIGKARSFRFKDWTDFEGTDELLGEGDGAATTFQLLRNYTSGPVTYSRTIRKPVTGTVVVKVAGVVVGASVDYATGIVTIAAPALGADVTASFEFDVPVRFDTDKLNIRATLHNAAAIESMPLVEVFDE